LTFARLASDGDPQRLAAFSCCRGPAWERLVEDWIQQDAWDWFCGRNEDNDRRLLLIDDPVTDELLAVGSHEVGERPWERHIGFVAVALHHRRQPDGSGPRLGKRTLATVLADANNRTPGGVATWLVDPWNRDSIILSERIGAEWISDPDHKPLLRFRLYFPSA
jgi:hypothetical protein